MIMNRFPTVAAATSGSTGASQPCTETKEIIRGRPERTTVVYRAPMTTATVTIRKWCESDSIAHLTDLLHRAYKPLADMGLHFVATHQSENTTRGRIRHGCFVAELDGQVIGTIAYHPPGTNYGCIWYDRNDIAYFGQFAVEPALQRTGIGSQLIKHVEDFARLDGATELGFDTSEHATHLIEYYRKRGYRFVQHVTWDEVNYRSAVMSKRL
jgi:GNAT superfamily N-acetyltransferase